jgi:hypothetical protein
LPYFAYFTVGLLVAGIPIIFAIFKASSITILMGFFVKYAVFVLFATAMAVRLVINCFLEGNFVLFSIHS